MCYLNRSIRFVLDTDFCSKARNGNVKANRLEPGRKLSPPPPRRIPFRYFNRSPEVIRLTVMIDIRNPLSLRQIEDL